MKKKLLAIIMSLTMILVFMPAMAFAEDSGSEVISIVFMPVEQKVVYDYYLKDECELTEDGYLYYPELIEGDSIEITYKNNTKATYRLTDGDDGAIWVNENDPDDVIATEYIFISPACIPESAASNDSFSFEIEYLDVTASGTVVFRTSNISGITYVPKANAITLYKGVDEINDDGDIYFDFQIAYDYLYGSWNDEVVIEYNDGTPSETVALDELGNWNYVTKKNGEYISLYEAQQETPWDVGDIYDIFLKVKGVIDTTNKITVKIETSTYNTFSFTQSQQYLYVFETDMLEYDPDDDEYVLQDADTLGYSGSDGDTLSFTLDDGSKVEFEYGRIENDPDYPYGWDGFVTTDADGNKSRLQREIRFTDNELRWKKDADGHYINNTARLTYMGAVSDDPVVSYAGCQVWFDPNGGEGNANTGVPIGMSINDMPDNIAEGFQPTRDGYTLSGWYEKDPATGELKAEPFDFNTKIYEETFLYAKWEKDHEWEDGYTVDVPATCTTDGSESIHCKDCEATKDSRVIPAPGHSYGEWITIKEPTVDEEGLKERTCSVCGDAESEVLPKIPAQLAADEAIAEAEAARIEAENAAKDAEEAQKAADEAAKTPGDVAVAAAENAKTVANIAKKAAEAYMRAAEKADKAVDKAIEQAETDEEKAAANASKEASSALVTGAEAAVDTADKAVETADASVTAAEKAKTEAEEAAVKKAQEEAAAVEAARQGTPDSKIPKVQGVKKSAVKKTSITVKWTKLDKKKLKKSKATKYEIWVCPNAAFGAADTKIKMVSKSKSSAKITGLKKNTKYYVKVRAIRTVGSTKYVGKWSARKTIKTPKK